MVSGTTVPRLTRAGALAHVDQILQSREWCSAGAAASPHDSGGDSTPLEPSRLAGVMARRMYSRRRLNHGCRRTLTSGVLRDASAYLSCVLRKPSAERERACGASAGEHRRRSCDRVEGWRAGTHLIVISTTERGGEATMDGSVGRTPRYLKPYCTGKLCEVRLCQKSHTASCHVGAPPRGRARLSAAVLCRSEIHTDTHSQTHSHQT